MIKILKVIEGCKEPTKGSVYSAGIDLYASADIVIEAGETAIVGLGVYIDISDTDKKLFAGEIIKRNTARYLAYDEAFDIFLSTHYLELHPRSGLRAKGIISGVGIIDFDFAGIENEIKIIIHNPLKDNSLCTYKDGRIGINLDIDSDFFIKKGDKIAQILLKEHQGYLFGVESDEERLGGFGSTGN